MCTGLRCSLVEGSCSIVHRIVSFLKRAGRPAITVLDEEKGANFQSVDETVIIARINSRDEHITTAFKTIASQFRDRASFGSLDTLGSTTVTCYNNRDEQKFTLSDLTAVDALPKLVESCMTPLIGEFTRANEIKYLQVRSRELSSPTGRTGVRINLANREC
jgi:protein disulfide-isomerase A1